MGKKNKDQEPTANLNSVANRDIVQRINFLYQASTYLNSLSQSLPPTTEDVKQPPAAKYNGSMRRKGKKKTALRHPHDTSELSRSYINTMRIVGQKTMVRMDPSIKRTLCKGCDAVLLPGSTATVRIKTLPSHGQAVIYTCLTCNISRRIPAPPVETIMVPVSTDHATSTDSLAAASASTSVPGVQTEVPTTELNIDAAGPSQPGRRRNSRRAHKGIPRAPPLFERKGHIIFRGNERLSNEDLSA
ncbi:RNAse P Rpr2/Rpp21/SNM1 subunit domain-containing protein [Trametes meyenii]|nr:RNAse P Rpr2/Rpp21/SNM1 subunit domain-containing protein [Trametes meyenii]